MNFPAIIEKDGKKAVSARELYDALGYDRSQWKRWYKKNITDNPFAVINQDWVGFDIMSSGNPTMDFALSLDFAKRLSMLARTEAGEKIRNYFIEAEKVAVQATAQLEPEELMLRQVQMMIEQKKRLVAIENDVKQLKAQTQARPDYYTVAGFATLNGIKGDLSFCAKLGKIAAKICRDHGWVMGTTPDPRFGKVYTYPREALECAFAQPVN